MPISMAEAGAERERERERKESRAMPLRERVENGEGETLRFGGSEERAITVDRKVAEEEQKGETTVDNGIVTACFCSATFVTLRGSFGCCFVSSSVLSYNFHTGEIKSKYSFYPSRCLGKINLSFSYRL